MDGYKKNTVDLGCSDIASLTVRYCSDMQNNYMKADVLIFGSDGDYTGYIVEDDNVVIPDYYKLVLEAKTWIVIYDDDSLVYKARAKKIEIYRAGDFGCIIKLIGKNQI